MGWRWLLEREEVAAVRTSPASLGQRARWPQWLPRDAVARLEESGIPEPWEHQVEAAERAYGGEHVVLATPTGSGKSLAYLMPLIASTWRRAPTLAPGRFAPRRPTALYLAPTKALSHDQLRSATELGPSGWRIGALDGDSERGERSFASDHAGVVFSNPDMLHYSILANHRRWNSLLAGLKFVVVDEAHRYQGVFGAHVAVVLRRLRRVCALYGANPTFILASATLPDAHHFASELIGAPTVAAVSDSSAASAERTCVLWRAEATTAHDLAPLVAQLADDGVQTLAFVPSRAGAELLAREVQELAATPQRVAAYRGGYLASERRELEQGLQDRSVLALATTNALELGIDVSGVDAVVVAGYPGRLSALRQQWGRAGRAGQPSVGVLIGRQNPLDAYLLDHPELIFEAPLESAVLHPTNPRILALHLAAAAQEHPVSAEDERWFGPALMPLLERLAEQSVLRDRGGQFFWTRAERAVDYVNLRSASGRAVEVIERDTGRLVGLVDPPAAPRVVHEGAVYLHQGEAWMVAELDLDAKEAIVVPAEPGYYTQAQSEFEIEVLSRQHGGQVGHLGLSLGAIRLTSRVVSYLRRDETSHAVWDSAALDLPPSHMDTQAAWWCVPAQIVSQLGWSPLRLGAALHAAEHTSIGLLGAFAACDRWDIGGLSTPLHPDTQLPTVFVYDGAEGGAGFAQRAFEVAEEWLLATLERLQQCPCEAGCPQCIHSPKCGNANQHLDKSDARALLQLGLQFSTTSQ